MPDTEVKQLLLQVDASVELLRRNLGAAEKRVAGFEQSVKAGVAKTDAHFGKLGTGLVGIKGHLDTIRTAMAGTFATAAVAAIGNAIKSALDYASALGETAQQLGVTTDELQEYRYAASQVGVEQEEMDKSLAKLTRTMGEAVTGGKKQAAVFEDLGINLRDASGRIKTAGAIIPEIADALMKIPDPARRAAIEVDLLGKTGQKLDTLLSGGAKSVNNLRDAAHALGIVMSEKEIQDADDAADKLSKLKQVLEAKISIAVARNADSIIKLADAMSNLIDKAGRLYAAFERFGNSDFGKGLEKLNQFAKLLSPLGMASAAGGHLLDALAAEPAKSAPKGGGAPAASYPGVGKPATTAVSGKIDPRLLQMDPSGKFGKTNLTPDTPGLFGDLGVGKMQGVGFGGLIDPVSPRTAEAIESESKALAEAQRMAAAIAEETYQTEMDALRDQFDLTDSTAERRRIAEEMVDLEYDHRIAVLDGIAASEEATAADKARARIARAAVEDRRAADKAKAGRDNEGPGARYLRELTTEATNLGDAFESAAVRGLGRLNDSLSDSVKNALGLHGVLGDIVGDLIEIAIRQSVIGPIASGLFGGLFGGIFGGGKNKNVLDVFGGFRASGGPVNPGSAYVVGEKRPELFVPRVPGVIIPQVPSGGGSNAGGISITIPINAPGATAETVSMIRREIAGAAPMIAQAATALTVRQANRRRL